MRKSWFRRLLLSYMPIFIIVITLIFFVVFQSFSEQSRKEALHANTMLSHQAMRLIDTSLRTIDNMIVLETINSKPLHDFFAAGRQSDPYINISTVQKLKEMMNYYPLIDSVYLVRNADEFVLSNATSSDISQYMDRSFIEQYQVTRTPRWTEGRMFKQFDRVAAKQVVSLVRGFPYMQNNQGMVVINVATERLNSLIKDLNDSDISFIQVSDAHHMQLFGTVAGGNQAQIYAHAISSYTGWTYGSGLVHGKQLFTIFSLFNIWFVIGLVMIMLGLVWIVYVTRRHSRPIEQIAARLSGYSVPLHTGQQRKAVDEFTFIEAAFDNVLEQARQVQQKYQADLHLRTRYLFHQLIEGSSAITRKEWEEQAEELKLPIPTDTYRLLVVEIDKYGEFCSHYSKSDQHLLKFALHSVIEEVASRLALTQWSEWTSTSALSVMIMSEEDTDQNEATLRYSFIEQIRAWIEQNVMFTITIGIGQHVREMSDIPKSYKTAAEVLKYKAVLGENRQITYEDIASQNQAEIYAHLNEIRSIATLYRKLDDAWSLQYDSWFLLMKQGRLTNDEIGNLIHYLMYYIGRELSASSKEYKQIWEQEGLPRLGEQLGIERGIGGMDKSLDTLHDQLKLVLVDMKDSLQAVHRDNQHAVLIREIRRLVEQQFTNPSMSLEWLGEQFAMNPKYISRLFKAHTGEKFVDVLIELRVREAERMLTDTRAGVHDIALAVGYASAISFSRVFKRMTGYSPGEYRIEQEKKRKG